MSKQSMRQIAAELGISPAYLSYMLNGKRPWRKDLYQRYMGVVSTFVNSEAGDADSAPEEPYRNRAVSGSFEVGAGRGTRTHTPVKVADFKSAASAIPPSRLFRLGLHRLNLQGVSGIGKGSEESEGSLSFGGDGRIRTAE